MHRIRLLVVLSHRYGAKVHSPHGHFERVFHDIRDVDIFRSTLILVRVGHKLAYDLGCILRVTDYVLGVFLEPRIIGRLREYEIRRSKNCAEWVIDLVRYAGHKRSNTGHFFGLNEFLL